MQTKVPTIYKNIPLNYKVSICLFAFIFSSCQYKSKVNLENKLALGESIYTITCQSCHQADGQGIYPMHPPLAGSEWVTGSKERLIKVLLEGLDREIMVKGQLYDEVMPDHDSLSNEQMSAVLTYVRESFGNSAGTVSIEAVDSVRRGLSLHEPLALSDVLPANDYEQRKVTGGVASRVGSAIEAGAIHLDEIQAPPGFEVSIFAEGLQNPRSLALGPKGTVFVGSRKNETDFVYAIRDDDQDWKADTIIKIEKGLEWRPLGVAMRDGDLYVGEIHRVVRYQDIENHLLDPPEPEVIYEFPREKKHGDKYIAFGPDDKLYVPVGAPCNSCLEDNPIFATITRMDPDGSNFEIFAHGVRNSRGFDWHPQTQELWFCDNGRDHLGDDLPPCEVNRAPSAGLHFGFPFCHGSEISDPEFGTQKPCTNFQPTAFNLVAHAAPVSLLFYTGTQFPEDYHGSILVSEHGSWNRSKKQGYRVMKLHLDGNQVVAHEPFLTGWLDHQKDDAWGRPVDLLQMPDGSLLLSDDYAGVIYRVAYTQGVNL
ncbi:MAG: c-type cytochrome [Saprospiraceae bacterium]|nr:c-type cytochrome [Saprospiraceae bacterium]